MLVQPAYHAVLERNSDRQRQFADAGGYSVFTGQRNALA